MSVNDYGWQYFGNWNYRNKIIDYGGCLIRQAPDGLDTTFNAITVLTNWSTNVIDEGMAWADYKTFDLNDDWIDWDGIWRWGKIKENDDPFISAYAVIEYYNNDDFQDREFFAEENYLGECTKKLLASALKDLDVEVVGTEKLEMIINNNLWQSPNTVWFKD